MRWLILIPLLAGCPGPGTEVRLDLRGELPVDPVFAISVVDADGLVLAASGDPDQALRVTEGPGRVARVTVTRGRRAAVFQGVSEPFEVGSSGREVSVTLTPAPSGRIVSIPARTVSSTVALLIEAEDWQRIDLGPALGAVTQSVERLGDQTSVMVPYVIPTPCLVSDGCRNFVFVDFVGPGGALGEHVEAEILLDPIPPSVDRIRVEYNSDLVAADRLGSGSGIDVRVRTSEPVALLGMALNALGGDCPDTVSGECRGTGRSFTCTSTAPTEVCEGRFEVELTLTDETGVTATWARGSEVRVDTEPPEVQALSFDCTSSLVAARGRSDGLAVELLRGATTLTTAQVASDGLFVVTASGADTLRALDGGGNRLELPVVCP